MTVIAPSASDPITAAGPARGLEGPGPVMIVLAVIAHWFTAGAVCTVNAVWFTAILTSPPPFLSAPMSGSTALAVLVLVVCLAAVPSVVAVVEAVRVSAGSVRARSRRSELRPLGRYGRVAVHLTAGQVLVYVALASAPASWGTALADAPIRFAVLVLLAAGATADLAADMAARAGRLFRVLADHLARDGWRPQLVDVVPVDVVPVDVALVVEPRAKAGGRLRFGVARWALRLLLVLGFAPAGVVLLMAWSAPASWDVAVGDAEVLAGSVMVMALAGGLSAGASILLRSDLVLRLVLRRR